MSKQIIILLGDERSHPDSRYGVFYMFLSGLESEKKWNANDFYAYGEDWLSGYGCLTNGACVDPVMMSSKT